MASVPHSTHGRQFRIWVYRSSDPNVVTHQGRYGRGTAAGLVGSYEAVAARIAHFHAAGIETFMLQFRPFEAEMRRFAAEMKRRA